MLDTSSLPTSQQLSSLPLPQACTLIHNKGCTGNMMVSTDLVSNLQSLKHLEGVDKT